MVGFWILDLRFTIYDLRFTIILIRKRDESRLFRIKIIVNRKS